MLNLTLEEEVKVITKLTKNRWKHISKFRLKRLKLLNKLRCSICHKEENKVFFYLKLNRHKNCQKTVRKVYYIKNKEKIKYQVKVYDKVNKNNLKSRKKLYEQKNKVIIRKKRNAYTKIRRKNDPLFSLADRLRSRLRGALKTKKFNKKKRLDEYLGCSITDLKIHIESLFLPGMSWNNRKEWHIDHIIPLSSAKTVDDMYKLSHYTNLQPLWQVDNLKKSGKIFYLTCS